MLGEIKQPNRPLEQSGMNSLRRSERASAGRR